MWSLRMRVKDTNATSATSATSPYRWSTATDNKAQEFLPLLCRGCWQAGFLKIVYNLGSDLTRVVNGFQEVTILYALDPVGNRL